MVSDRTCDVLVVGAGPSGSMAAKYAALGGANVLMVEKRQEIGAPVRCGEGMAKRWLDRCGIRPSSEWIANEVDGARIISPGGFVLEVDEKHAGNECGYVIHRDAFDRALAKDAADAGADIMVKTSAVELLKQGEQIVGAKCRHFGELFDVRAKLIIGADGFESQVGRWAGIDTRLNARDIDACYQTTLVGCEVDRRFNDFYIGSIAPGGYIWIFPKGDDCANVGIGVQLMRCKGMADAKTYLDRWMKSHPELTKGRSIMEVCGAVSVSAPLDRTVAHGVMLVGDAARMIDPVTGGGIYHGCVAGMFAGQVSNEALEANDFSEAFLQRYERRWREELEERLYRNWMVKEKFASLTDEQLDKVVEAVSKVDFERMTTTEILRAVKQTYPELVKEFEGLF